MVIEDFAKRYGLPYDPLGKVDMTGTLQAVLDFSALETQVAALEADARRYRWLRERQQANDGTPFIARYRDALSHWNGNAADMVIDAAMADSPTAPIPP